MPINRAAPEMRRPVLRWPKKVISSVSNISVNRSRRARRSLSV
jgi:hypothetical protein